MKPSRADQILDEFAAVSGAAPRPASPPRRMAVRAGGAGATLAGASLVVVALVVAVALLNGPRSDGTVGALVTAAPSATPTTAPTPTPTASPSPTPTPAPTASPTPVPTATPATPTPTKAPAIGPCNTADLAARILSWEGAAGHRIASVEMTNTGAASCHVRAMAKPQLVDGKGAVLIDGQDPPASANLTVTPGGVLKTLVQDGNYCGPDPIPPVSVAFVTAAGRVVASPVSPTDATLPPCNGSPGSAGDIEMQPWTH